MQKTNTNPSEYAQNASSGRFFGLSSGETGRSSNIELLRIIAIFLILCFHCCKHSAVHYPPASSVSQRSWMRLMGLGGRMGVNVFILISGYFLCKSGIKIRKLILIYLQMVTYSILIFVFLKICDYEIEYLPSFVQRLFPVSHILWWFATGYVILSLLFPLLNLFVNHMGQAAHRNVLIAGFIVWSLIYTFSGNEMYCNHVIWFCYLYVCGAYIRCYMDRFRHSAAWYLILALVMYALLFILSSAAQQPASQTLWKRVFAVNIHEMKTAPVFLISVLLLVGFARLQIPPNKIINTIASTSFGIYLIHDEPNIRKLLWTQWFSFDQYVETGSLVWYSLGAVFITFAICSGIEMLRKLLINRLQSYIHNNHHSV